MIPQKTTPILLTPLIIICFAVAFIGSLQSIPGIEHRAVVRGRHGMVVSADSFASAAGLEVLRAGGNAIDAAVATGFALAVTYPEAGNIGGGGFMVIRMADGRTAMIDFREKAPASATRGMFLDEHGDLVPGKSTSTALAAGVPGTVDGLLLALQRYGTLSRGRVLAPALQLARDGFRVREHLASSLEQDLLDSSISAGALRVFAPHGVPVHSGDTLRQTDLAATLQRISDEGADGFYRGPVASLVADQMRKDGGAISVEDLAAYHAVERKPLAGSYRGYQVISSAPPSSGGIVLLEMLNILEQFPLSTYGPMSPRTWHLFCAAAQRAYADRARYLGDPDFVTMPVDSLISKAYARDRAASIDPLREKPSAEVQAGIVMNAEHKETTHYCVADSAGNVVSVTVTLNELYGCRIFVDGAGFFLNDEMDDFVAKPGVPNMFGLTGGEENSIAPGKRMLSSMTPTILVRDNRPVMLTGARGGSRIITSTAQVIMNVVDFGMDIASAAAAPRLHYQWLPDEVLLEKELMDCPLAGQLRSMGYTVLLTESNARTENILVDPLEGCYVGGPDPREPGVAVAY